MAKKIKIKNRMGRTFEVAIGSVVESTETDGKQKVTGMDKKNGCVVLELESEWCYADMVTSVS